MVPASDVAALFDWAQRHALALFPIKAFCKQPRGIVYSHTADCSKDPAQWRRWYDEARGCNFGVECGKSGIVVVDVDVDKATWTPLFDARWAEWANGDSFCVMSPSNGWHLYCRAPAGIDPCEMASPDWVKGQIDIQSGNKFVVAPWCETRRSYDPKVKRDGFYRIVRDRPEFPACPPDLAKHCEPVVAIASTAPSPGEDFREDGFPKAWAVRVNVQHRVNSLIHAFRNCPPKTRNDTLNETSFTFGRLVASGLLDRGAAEMLLHAEGVAIGQSRDETIATTRSGLNAGVKAGPEPLGMKIDELLGAELPLLARAVEWAPPVESEDPDVPTPPIIEWLIVKGCTTVLAGGSGSGKTTVVASLMAASAAGLKHFDSPEFGKTHSDVVALPAAWLCFSYEGGGYMDIHRRAWHIGMSAPELYPERRRLITFDGPLVSTDEKRRVVFDMKQVGEIDRAIAEMQAAFPNLPLVIAFDNISAAVSDQMDQAQASEFMRAMRLLARRRLAVMLLAHPPKGKGSTIFGSHLFFSFADIVARLEVIREGENEWVQWIGFDKHRGGAMHRSLELRSRRLDHPIVDLPTNWAENPKGRQRALEDFCTPYIFQIQAKKRSEKDLAAAGGRRVDAVSAKESAVIPVVVSGAPTSEGGVILTYKPRAP